MERHRKFNIPAPLFFDIFLLLLGPPRLPLPSYRNDSNHTTRSEETPTNKITSSISDSSPEKSVSSFKVSLVSRPLLRLCFQARRFIRSSSYLLALYEANLKGSFSPYLSLSFSTSRSLFRRRPSSEL